MIYIGAWIKNINSENTTKINATCLCTSGFINTPETLYKQYKIKNKKNIIKCCYRQKKVKYAFLGEAFFGFGLGYFYLENYNLFFIKLITNVSICCIICFSGFFINKRKENNKIIFTSCNILNFILLCVFIVWKIVDFILFGLNLVKDKNGAELDNEW